MNQTSLRSQLPILSSNVGSRTCPSSISPTSPSAWPSQASLAHFMTGTCTANFSGICCLETRKENFALPESKGKTFADLNKLALAKETAKKAADQISSSVVGAQSAAVRVHGSARSFVVVQVITNVTVPADEVSWSYTRRVKGIRNHACYRCGGHGHSPTESFYKDAKCHFTKKIRRFD